MSRRTRMVELMAAAGLAPQLLEREKERGQQEAQTTGMWTNALDKLATGALNTGIDVAQKSADEDANTAAQESITAGNMDPLDRLASTGSINPFRNAAIEKARAAAGTGIEKKGIETQQRDLETKAKQAQIDSSKATTDIANKRETREAGAAADAQKRQTTADQVAAGKRASQNAAEIGFAKGKMLGQIAVENPDLDEGELAAAYNALKDADEKKALDTEGKNADIGLKKSETSKNYAASKASAAGGQKGAPFSEGAKKDIAGLKTQLDQIDQLQKQKGGIDTGALSTFQNDVAQFMGIDDPSKTAFRAQIAGLRDDMLHALSGAAISPSEMSRLMEGLPTFSDNDEAFGAKLAAAKARVQSALKNRVSTESSTSAAGAAAGIDSNVPPWRR